MNKHLVLLIDSNALIHRAYHAYPKTLSTKSGELTNAVFGFFSIVLQMILKYGPKEVYFAFDSKEKTFRHEIYPDYKGTRKKIDDELIAQFKTIKEILRSARIPYLEKDGYEADDIIGTLSRRNELDGMEKIIVTGDGDLLQLINNEVRVLLSGSAFKKSVLYDSITAEKKLGYTITQVIEYKALRGDTSDNIPGVPGIGEVTTKKLLAEYKNLEEIYKNIEGLPKSIRNKIAPSRDMAFMSRDLATIDTHAPISLDATNFDLRSFDYAALGESFVAKEFRTLLPSLKNVLLRFSDIARQSKPQHASDSGVDNRRPKEAEGSRLTEQEITSIMDSNDYVIFSQKYPDQESCTDVYVLNKDSVFLTSIFSEEYRSLIESLESKNIEIVSFNSKYFHKLHIQNGLNPLKFKFDIKLAGYLLSGGDIRNDLPSLALSFLNEVPNDNESLDNAYLLRELYIKFKELFSNEGEGDWSIYSLFTRVEVPLSLVLARMELCGILLDIGYLNSFEKKISLTIEDIKKKIFQEVGEDFNLASPKQLGEILFGKLNLPGKKRNKNGGYSTNEKVLSKLVNEYPVVKRILEYRELAKLKSTYTSTLVNQVNKDTHRIHSKFRQDVAATGRLSSTDPNLQNIPISTELGQEVRRAFIAGEKRRFVFFDYSQQELRLLAHLSQEENLVKAFVEDVDIHTLTASMLLNIELNEVTKSQRRIGKTVNFGIIYGISAFGLSERLQIDADTGQKYIDGFFGTYPKVREYYDWLLLQAQEKGFITTILGRKKYTDKLNSLPFQARKAVEREIMNFPLQGSAADMIKVAMVKAQEIIDNKYKNYAELVLQIHDELVFEVSDKDEELLKVFAKEISEMMLHVFKLRVNMKVSIEVGSNLADSKQLFIN